MEKVLLVAVCTYNRGDVLKNCLESLSKQVADTSKFDVVVIDNNSNDNTKQISEDFVKRFKNFQYIFESEQGLSIARNRAYLDNSHEYIAYIDDDARAPIDWVSSILKIIEEFHPDIIGGPIYPYFIGSKPEWFKDQYGSYSIYDLEGWTENDTLFSGSNITLKRELLVEYGGFNKDIGMKGDSAGYHEETLLQLRAKKDGKTSYYSKKVYVEHLVSEEKKNIIYYLYSAFKSGSDLKEIRQQKLSFKDILKISEDISEIFADLESAKRKTEGLHPENFIIENVRPKIESLGFKVQYLKERKNLKKEIISSLSRDDYLDFGTILSGYVLLSKSFIKLIGISTVRFFRRIFKKIFK